MRSNVHVSPEDVQMGPLAGRVFRVAGLVGVAALVLSIALGFADLERFFRSWLTAFIFGITICLGALFFVMIQHVVHAGWSVTVRRVWEALAANLTWFWVLFIPVVWGLLANVLYAKWTGPDVTNPALIAHKWPFLTKWFFLGAAVVALASFALLARYFWRESVAQDADGDPQRTLRMQKWAAGGIIIYAITQTVASLHWVMSLEPAWFSTMYPVYFFAVSMTGFFSVSIITFFLLQRGGRLRNEVTAEHYQDLGKLLFAFAVVFWAYIGYSQFMLIWYANVPEETTWFLARLVGGWRPLMWFLLLGHFVIPFVAIISKHPKRVPAVITGMACWMLFMHYVDVYLLVMPTIPDALLEAAPGLDAFEAAATAENAINFPQHPVELILDLSCLVAVAGLLAAGTARRLGAAALVPVRDPRLEESLAFENV